MKAIVTYPPRKNSAVIVDIPVPEPGRGEALLRILEVGIDGTDREIYRGEYGTPPEGFDYLVAGHEALARVERLGPGVEGLEEGDLVVPTVRRPDDCINCRAGEPDMCSKGNYREHGIYRLHGFASEYATTNASFLVKVPKVSQKPRYC